MTQSPAGDAPSGDGEKINVSLVEGLDKLLVRNTDSFPPIGVQYLPEVNCHTIHSVSSISEALQ